MKTLAIHPLTAENFQPFGEVIEAKGHVPISVNQGFAKRYRDLCTIDVSAEGGTAIVSLFHTDAYAFPLSIQMMERHPLGSQAFMPLQPAPWLVLTCSDPADDASYKAFRAEGHQGVNYARGVWHHPLLVFEGQQRFLVIDRGGPGNNLQEHWRDAGDFLSLSP